MWLAGANAWASHDSFLFGEQEKITTWDGALKASDLGIVSLINSGWQANLNQVLVDQYLARTVLNQLAPDSKSLKQIDKVSRAAEVQLLTKFSNLRLARAEKILQLHTLARAQQFDQARNQLIALIVFQQSSTTKEPGKKEPDKKTPGKEQSGKKQSGKKQPDKKQNTAKAKLSFAAAYQLAMKLANDLKNSEPENSRSLLTALNLLAQSGAKVKSMKPFNLDIGQNVDAEAESLYSDGVALFKAGQFEKAEAKLRQALTAYEQASGEKRLLQERETRLALAQSLSGLDRREEALQHFSAVIENLKQSPLSARPQTDETVEQFIRLAEIGLVDLPLPPAKNYIITQEQKDKVVHSLHALVSAAYLCKIDGKLSEAAHLFRKANLVSQYYFPELEDLRSSVSYDLGETLFWAGSCDEAEHYMTEALNLREKKGKTDNAAVDTRSTLGRILIAAERGEFARRFYLETMQLLAAREFGAPVDNFRALSFEQLTEQLSQHYFKTAQRASDTASESFKRQFSDALQGYADASIACKRYDQATISDAVLLSMREAKGDEKDQVLATLWQMAWVAQMANQFEESARLYTRMIEEFPQTKIRQVADWYQSRAIALDLLGRYKEATSDFKKARDGFKICLKDEQDLDEIDRLTWTIGDIEYNLLSRHKSPPSDSDYLKAEPTCFWQAKRFPLKVFVESSTTNGFGGDLKKLMLKAMAQWTDFENSPVKLAFVDSAKEADVYIERVTSYDDIPYSSAGRTSVIYVNGDAGSRALDKAHVRVYCPSYDGESSVQNGIDKIINQEMSSFAKTHLYTLFMHEFGHVIGVGHSPAGQDVMYWKSCSSELSSRDRESIRKLYRHNQK